MFQIFIKSINGKTIYVDVNETDTILQVKQKIFTITKVPIIYHILLYNTKILLDTKTIQYYDIKGSDTIWFTFRVHSTYFYIHTDL